MQAVLDPNGDVWFRFMPPICAHTLTQLPAWLTSDDPRVRDRLLPRVYEDDEDEETWRRYGASELEHLFKGREEIVRKDLATLEPEGEYTFRIRIRAQHVAAWVAALNAARLALFTLHELEARDMEADPNRIEGEERQIALFRIHNMAVLQELLLRAKSARGPGAVSWDDEADDDGFDEDEGDLGGRGPGGDIPDGLGPGDLDVETGGPGDDGFDDDRPGGPQA